MGNSIQAAIEQFTLPHPSGEGSFTISVSRVANMPEGTKDVPVLFVLDADFEFALAAEIARVRGMDGSRPAAIVVGIGYGAPDFATFAKLRTADLTPPLSEASKAALGNLKGFIGDKDGGAEAFLAFLADTLVSEITRRYPEASPTDHILFGHSLGGLFVAYALLVRPDAFATFLTMSPSLWWDGFAILSHLPAFAGRIGGADRKPRVLVGVGGKEQEIPTSVPAGMPLSLEEVQALVASSRMVDAADEFAQALKQAGLTQVGYVAFQDEDHGSVLAAAMMRGLAFAVPSAA